MNKFNKVKWDSYYANKEIKNFGNDIIDSLNDDLNYDYKRVDKIKGYYHITNKNIYNTFTFKNNSKKQISDMYIKVFYNDYGDDILSKIMDFHIVTTFGNNIFSSMDISINLFFSSLMGKEIIEKEDGILFPVIILNFFNKERFPLNKLVYHDVKITILNGISNKMELYYEYEYADINMDISVMWDSIISKCRKLTLDGTHCKKSSIYLNMKLVVKFIFFEFYSKIELFGTPILNEVKLYLDDLPPIIFRSELDEIMRFDIHGKTLYGISLSPEYRTQEDLKYIMNQKTCELEQTHELKKYLDQKYRISVQTEKDFIKDDIFFQQNGINFSKVDRQFITFNIDCDCNDMDIKITYLNANRIIMTSGMVGFKYC